MRLLAYARQAPPHVSSCFRSGSPKLSRPGEPADYLIAIRSVLAASGHHNTTSELGTSNRPHHNFPGPRNSEPHHTRQQRAQRTLTYRRAQHPVPFQRPTPDRPLHPRFPEPTRSAPTPIPNDPTPQSPGVVVLRCPSLSLIKPRPSSQNRNPISWHTCRQSRHTYANSGQTQPAEINPGTRFFVPIQIPLYSP